MAATRNGNFFNRRLELVALHRDGHQLPVEMTVWPLGQHDSFRFNAFVHDITERKRAEEIQRAKEAAELASRSKSQFLANMSHEIRSPMTAIFGFTALLADPDTPTHKRAEYVETVRRNGNHLLGIVNDVLDLSKIEAGQLSVERVLSSPAMLVAEVAALLRPAASDKGLEFAVVYRSAIPESIRTGVVVASPFWADWERRHRRRSYAKRPPTGSSPASPAPRQGRPRLVLWRHREPTQYPRATSAAAV
jgi:signal transduction histidine kinase